MSEVLEVETSGVSVMVTADGSLLALEIAEGTSAAVEVASEGVSTYLVTQADALALEILGAGTQIDVVQTVSEVSIEARLDVLEVLEVGVSGPSGPPGLPGTAGAAGATGPQGPTGGVNISSYLFSTASTQWVVTHAYPYRPAVETYDQNGDPIEGDVTFPTSTTVRVTWAYAMTGSLSLF